MRAGFWYFAGLHDGVCVCVCVVCGKMIPCFWGVRREEGLKVTLCGWRWSRPWSVNDKQGHHAGPAPLPSPSPSPVGAATAVAAVAEAVKASHLAIL